MLSGLVPWCPAGAGTGTSFALARFFDSAGREGWVGPEIIPCPLDPKSDGYPPVN